MSCSRRAACAQVRDSRVAHRLLSARAMRTLIAISILTAACSTQGIPLGGGGDGPPTTPIDGGPVYIDGGVDLTSPQSCPATRNQLDQVKCTQPVECDYPSDNGLTARCNCDPSSGRFLCNDCPWSMFPATSIYDCHAMPKGCTLETWEWTFTCDCLQPDFRGICCGGFPSNQCPSPINDGDPCCPVMPWQGGDPSPCPPSSGPVDLGVSCTCSPTDARWHCG
jgi:hypothetical protein